METGADLAVMQTGEIVTLVSNKPAALPDDVPALPNDLIGCSEPTYVTNEVRALVRAI